MRPLDRVPSIKLKLGLVIVAAVITSSVVVTIAAAADFPLVVGPVVGIVLSLALVQLLARGMTSPLREMASAARAMARGDYERRVSESSADEVGAAGRAFNAMARDLAEVDRVRRDLVGNVSHELRTPISALRACLENLVDGVETADPAVLRVMLEQTERLGRLVEQLLDLSRLEAGVAPFAPASFDLAVVLERVAAETRLRGDDVRLTVALAPDAPSGWGDAERIHQVLANLVDNAVRHSPVGGTVAVSAAGDGDALRLEVTDQGPGIDAIDADRVFERFWRADRARSADGSGAGLGLAIARWIVELHGGDIRAEQVDEGGCRMVVRLPSARRAGPRLGGSGT